MSQATYEVRVSGVIPEQDLRDIGAFAVETEPATTTVYGGIDDEAALYGLLTRLRSLGLEVVEVRKVPGLTDIPPDAPSGEDSTPS